VSLHQYLLALRARFGVFAALLLASVVAATVVSLLLPKSYRATVSLLVDKKDEQSLTDLLHKKLEEVDAIQKFLKDHEKANKKEDKKPEGMSTFQLASLFMVFALVAPLYLRILIGH